MAEDKYARIRLDSQLCFPLYACSRKIVQQYTPLLDELGITPEKIVNYIEGMIK